MDTDFFGKMKTVDHFVKHSDGRERPQGVGCSEDGTASSHSKMRSLEAVKRSVLGSVLRHCCLSMCAIFALHDCQSSERPQGL